VTLIGDVAHLMSPFGGEGANCEMTDGVDLGIALAQASDWRRAVVDFEANMFPRAEEGSRGAAAGLDGAISENGLAHTLLDRRTDASRLARRGRERAHGDLTAFGPAVDHAADFPSQKV
jgi:2-polyprenyl-6-methoxyphenol hydroxylase-like FAD-dependent oxidoreductase